MSNNICADCRREVENGKLCLCQQAKAYVEKMKPISTSEAKGYFRDFWDKQKGGV